MEQELLFEIKPKYNGLVRLISNPISANIGFFVGLGYMAFLIAENPDNYVLIYIFVFLLFGYGLAPFIFLYFDKKNFEVTKYKVYSDRVEFEEGFINHKYTTLQLKDVLEVHHTQNFFQRRVGLGTIKFLTAGNAETYKTRNYNLTGVAFRDIENSNVIYAKIKQLKEESKNE